MDPALVAQAAELCPALWDYADATHAVMYADADLRIVLDRIWHGYPDAPQFALAVFRGGRMRVLWNFQHWPQRWTITR